MDADTILRCIGYGFDFIWKMAPVAMLAVCTWRLTK